MLRIRYSKMSVINFFRFTRSIPFRFPSLPSTLVVRHHLFYRPYSDIKIKSSLKHRLIRYIVYFLNRFLLLTGVVGKGGIVNHDRVSVMQKSDIRIRLSLRIIKVYPNLFDINYGILLKANRSQGLIACASLEFRLIETIFQLIVRNGKIPHFLPHKLQCFFLFIRKILIFKVILRRRNKKTVCITPNFKLNYLVKGITSSTNFFTPNTFNNSSWISQIDVS